MKNKIEEANETMRGTVGRVKFSAPDTGYAIAIFDAENEGSQLNCTICGNLPQIAKGDEITIEGQWITHAVYGKQFKVSSYMKILPTNAAAIEAYLASGMIKGLGPSTAARIVKAFGTETLNILSNNPARLMEISGIGEKKCETIAKAWKEQTAVTDIMVFLSGCGITPAYATKIYRRYGLDSIRVINENPYDLSYTIDGIGFLVADRIARKIGYPENSPQRTQAGTLYTLMEGRKEGHVYLPEALLKRRAQELLEVDEDLVKTAIGGLLEARLVVIDDTFGERNVYTSGLYKHETEAARRIHELAYAPSFFKSGMKDVDEELLRAETKFGITLSPEQKKAVVSACRNTVSVLTGGPGTGKTLSTKVIVEIFKQKKAKIKLAAPTGRAAKRLENCGQEAKTIHRLLEFSPFAGGFTKSETDTLDCNVLIVDEMSMADISLFYALVMAIPKGAHLIIIGDSDQLPSVGPGTLMMSLADSDMLPLTVLKQIYRQEEGSGIVQLAHDINIGIIPGPTHFGKDCHFVELEDPAAAGAKVVEIVQWLRSKGEGDIQVLTPMNKGEIGTYKLNELLQEALNPVPAGQGGTYQVVSGVRKFRIGCRVIQTKNNYDRDVFNGDGGIIDSIDHEEKQLGVLFEGREPVLYDFVDLDELSLSYAMTVHKSQGSEYETVILVCMSQHFIMLARNLFYTGVSRAKKRVIIVGTKKAMAIAVRNDKQKARYSMFKERLQPELKIRRSDLLAGCM